jgi:hypothetical protein
MTDNREPPRLICRCSAPGRPISCIGGCGYLCTLLPKIEPAIHAEPKS